MAVDLSSDKKGAIVLASIASAITPREPLLGRSSALLLTSISSWETSGVAITIDLKLPTSSVGLKLTINSWTWRDPTVTELG